MNTPASQTDYPLVGVVTPVRNRRAWSVEFALRFCRQDYPFFKLYMVDSASTDGTPNAIRALGLDGIEVLDAPASAYWTAATNVGVRRALADGCDYILTINDDGIFADDFLSRIVQVASEANASIVGAVISYANDPGVLWGVGAYNRWADGAFVQTGLANELEDKLKPDPGAPAGLVRVDYLCGNGALFHRSVYEQIGLYDARNLPHYHGDTEFTMRAERSDIPRFVALEARVYNRFTESADGVFAAKNKRFFSLRSVNYVRPLLFIIDRYCDSDALRTLAFARYFARYLPEMTPRELSKFLRALRLVSGTASRPLCISDFIPPSDPDLALAADISLLLAFPPRALVLGAFGRLLRRSCSDEELTTYEVALDDSRARERFLRDIMSSAEYRARACGDDFGAALVGDVSAVLTPRQKVLLAWRKQHGRNPTNAEFDQATRDASPRVKSIVPTVYLNVDVLCMAMLDARAKTGVHRYAFSLIETLRVDPRINLKLFVSAELSAQFTRLCAERSEFRALADNDGTPLAAKAVVFYPYFPFGSKARRYAMLPQAMTLCDLFPLTNPEWFSTEAVERFRRQLHGLVEAKHVFCISQSTERELRAVYPALRARSSVSYLAAEPAEVDSRGAGFVRTLRRTFAKPYFVCIGTIEPRKNLRNVLAAFNRLGKEVSDLRMLVVGQEGWSVRADELRAIGGLNSDRIRFLGHVPDARLWQLYRGALCTVFPSLAEGFGLPILESFQCGVPVITSNTTSMREIATKGAILVDPHDPDDIAQAITRLACDAALRDRLAQEGAARAKEFSWSRCANDHVDVFLEIATRYPSR